MSYKLLVLEGITERGLQLLKAEGWQIDQHKAMAPEELVRIVGAYDAMTIRSGSQITAEVLEAGRRLKVVGRPGVGVDNVDLAAATRLGIMVMNSPMGNLVSTAELTLALLFAVARNVAQADAAMKAERWERKAFPGVELSGKRLGVVGFGRIGREVAARARALGMEIAAFDPFVAPVVAEAQHVPMLTLDELMETSDFITLHTTLTRESRHLIGKQALARVKRGARIVNAARGELIDEEALLAALDDGRVAAAGLDVHAQEPPADWRLAKHPRVVATPHVGAQTVEAQERVGTDIAIQVRDFLKGGIIQHAVNFFSLTGDVYDQVKPAMDLAQRLGAFLAQACPGTPERIEVGLYGDLREIDSNPIQAAAVCGVMRCAFPENVTLVNARALASEKGIDVVESTSSAKVAFSNLMAIRLKTSERDFSVAGTLFGRNHLRLVDVDGVEVDAIPQGHLLLVRNDDTPGVVGHLGQALGRRNINIARMTVGRKPGSGRAVMLIEVDNEVPPEVLAEVTTIPGVREARALKLGLIRVPIGFDLGGTKLLMVADGPAGRVAERAATGIAFDGRALSAAVESFLDSHRDAASAVGVAIPGLVGPGPFVQACDVLPAIVGRRPPASLTSMPFAMINDAAAALAEECHDAPSDITAAVVMAGTGIGAAMLVHGRPFGGANGWAGELGSIPLAAGPDGVRTLDQLASGQSLVARLGGDGATVRAHVEGGDQVARRAAEDAGTALGLGLATLIDLINPALVSVGGGLVDLPGYLDAALASAERHTLPDLWRVCRVRKVRAGELVAALGAARVASACGLRRR